MATLADQDRYDPATIYDGVHVDALADDRFTGWTARPSAGALLLAGGVGVLTGLVVFWWLARVIAGWLA